MSAHSKITSGFAALGLVLMAGGAANAEESFFEGFDDLDQAAWYISDGWTNGPHQNCWWSRDAVDLQGGVLVLKLLPTEVADRAYLCGEVQTDARYLHGTFEARFRTDHRHSGVNAAFFTYIGEVHEKPHDEIDVEVLTLDTGRVSFNTFVSGEMMNGATVPLDPPADAAFHTFSMIWEPDRIRWFIDGVKVHETAGDLLPENAQKIYLSHWSSDTFTDWMGPFANPERALEMEIDWVAWTAPGEGCQFEGSVLCTDLSGE